MKTNVFPYSNMQWWIMHSMSKDIYSKVNMIVISHWFCICREPHTHIQKASAVVTAVNPAVWKEAIWDGRVESFSFYSLLVFECAMIWNKSLTSHVCRWESSGCLRTTDVCGANVYRSMRKCSSSIQTRPATSWTHQPVHWAQSSSAIQWMTAARPATAVQTHTVQT